MFYSFKKFPLTTTELLGKVEESFSDVTKFFVFQYKKQNMANNFFFAKIVLAKFLCNPFEKKIDLYLFTFFKRILRQLNTPQL